ncbi:MAG: D-amino-acid transaminase [Proteobacteria bacterium]|jgi:D-alanine transaminase|nr:D-amino-acid transaminase [Pseudomonadota bacterium]
MSRTVFINGEYVPEEEAKVSVFDRGFIFGDGVYEVIPVFLGKLVDKQYFVERLDRSLSELSIAWPCSADDYVEVMRQLIERNGLQEGVVYSQVTRGVADRDFPFPQNATPSFMAFTSVMQLLNNPAAETGIKVVTTPDLRWKRRDIKSINLLGQVLAKQDAVSRGGKEGWMLEDGYITEGVSSSAYIVKDGVIITRPLSNSILPGIRRRTLLELAERESIGIEERLFTLKEALEADEAFISSATTMALGVVDIDGNKIGDGTPGPVTMKMRELYTNRVLEEARNS